MDSYVSIELTRKLRNQQHGLRVALRSLERCARAAETPQVEAEVLSVARLYSAHEALVQALLEAVEPDQPSFDPPSEEPLP